MRNLVRASQALTSAAFLISGLIGCSGGSDEGASTPVTLRFQAVDSGAPVSCDSVMTGLGPDGTTTVGLSDLRFYVSNVHFYDGSGNEIETKLSANDFQRPDTAGDVTLIDLTSNVSGSCTNSAIAFSEGTLRTNDAVQLLAQEGTVSRVTFDVGVPQSLMKKVVSTYTAEDAPSPLNEMYWSWASGYRHFVLNFTVHDRSGNPGEGYMHIGSRDCGDGALALTDKDSCGFVNTPSVVLDGFNPDANTVTVDLRKALNGLTFVTALYDSNPPYDLIGSGPGVACHSAPPDAQPDCAPVFANFGLDPATGASVASANSVFSYQ